MAVDIETVVVGGLLSMATAVLVAVITNHYKKKSDEEKSKATQLELVCNKLMDLLKISENEVSELQEKFQTKSDQLTEAKIALGKTESEHQSTITERDFIAARLQDMERIIERLRMSRNELRDKLVALGHQVSVEDLDEYSTPEEVKK